MNQRVEIVLSDGYYTTGGRFTGVDYFGSNYGGGCPCNNQKEINSAIDHAKKIIRDNGDIPIVVDKRESSKLTKWL